MARVAVDAITYAMEHSSTSSRNSSVRKEAIQVDPFFIFASNVVHRSEVKIPAILVSLVYIKRAKQHLFIQSPEWACERVFLGALILANKVGIYLISPSPPVPLKVNLMLRTHSMSTTGRSRITTGPYVLGYSAGATSAESNANSSMSLIGISP